MTSRIAFLDVDGTILEHGSVIAPSTPAAIAEARARGHLVYLCTGRAKGDLHPDVQAIEVDGAITNGGALVESGGRVLASHLMPRADVDRMIAFFEGRGIHFFLQSDAAVYASAGVGALAGTFFAERRRQHAADLERLGLPVDDDTEVIRYRPLAEADLDEITKAVFVSEAADGLTRAQSDLGPEFVVIPGSIPLPGGSNGEVAPRGVDKGSGIREVLAHLGIAREDAIGVGDSWNDIDMFDAVGTGVAIAGAPAELVARAAFTTTATLEDGVHNAFVRLGLI